MIETIYFHGHAGELESSKRYFQATAAITAPITGATINIQICAMAVPPTMSAGPRLRAGFTDVPVIGMPTIWIMASANPIGMPANPAGAVLLVAPKMTIRKINVRTTSTINPDIMEYPAGDADPYPF